MSRAPQNRYVTEAGMREMAEADRRRKLVERYIAIEDSNPDADYVSGALDAAARNIKKIINDRGRFLVLNIRNLPTAVSQHGPFDEAQFEEFVMKLFVAFRKNGVNPMPMIAISQTLSRHDANHSMAEKVLKEVAQETQFSGKIFEYRSLNDTAAAEAGTQAVESLAQEAHKASCLLGVKVASCVLFDDNYDFVQFSREHKLKRSDLSYSMRGFGAVDIEDSNISKQFAAKLLQFSIRAVDMEIGATQLDLQMQERQFLPSQQQAVSSQQNREEESEYGLIGRQGVSAAAPTPAGSVVARSAPGSVERPAGSSSTAIEFEV